MITEIIVDEARPVAAEIPLGAATERTRHTKQRHAEPRCRDVSGTTRRHGRDARRRRLRPEGDLVVPVPVRKGASFWRSIRTTGRMMTAAEPPGVRDDASRNPRFTFGNTMTAPIAPPGRFENSVRLRHASDATGLPAINAAHG